MILPWGVPPTVAGLIWKWIFNDSYGALNAGLYSTGIIDSYMRWLTTPELARMAVVLVFVWSQLPLAAIFLLAQVQAIPDDLYDAAAIDGAGPLRPVLVDYPARHPADADRRRYLRSADGDHQLRHYLFADPGRAWIGDDAADVLHLGGELQDARLRPRGRTRDHDRARLAGRDSGVDPRDAEGRPWWRKRDETEIPLRGILIYGGAALLAFFWFAPFVVVFMGSVIPEVNLISFPPRWFKDPPSIATFDYIFTGKVPASYEQRGALRSMISNEARDVPRAILNSFIVASAVMFINLVFGSMAAYAYARLRFPGRAFTFNFVLVSRLIPSVALAVPYYLIVLKLGLLNSLLGTDRDLLGPDAAVHDAGPDALLPGGPGGDR